MASRHLLAMPMLFAFLHSAAAADISPGVTGLCDFTLKNVISNGDVDKVERALRAITKNERATEEDIGTPTMCLDSGGGSYDEGLQIIKLMLRWGGVGTVINDGAKCISSCALVFMFGYWEAYHDDKFFDRRLHIKGKLGFHAPYLPPNTPNRVELIADSYRAGISAMQHLLRLDQNEFLPKKLVMDFMGVGPDTQLEIDTVGKAGEYTIELMGYGQPAAISSEMLAQACDNEDEFRYLRRIREYNISRFVEKTSPDQGRVWFGVDRGIAAFKGYSDEGGSTCVGRFQKADDEFAIELYIDADSTELQNLRQTHDFEISGGLMVPGFGDSKPIWFMRKPETLIRELARWRR